MNRGKSKLLDRYEGTLSCEASLEITTGEFPGGGQSIHIISIEHIITTERDSEFSQTQEKVVQAEDLIEASNKAYAALAPDERHELADWDATLDDGLNEY